MTDEHPDATAYRRTADALRAGDLEQLESRFSEDVVFHVPGNHPRAGDLRGRALAVAFLVDLRAGGFWLTEHDVFGNDTHVCALSTMGARRPGLDVETKVVSIFHFRDGRQLERWFFPEDATTWDQILAGALGPS